MASVHFSKYSDSDPYRLLPPYWWPILSSRILDNTYLNQNFMLNPIMVVSFHQIELGANIKPGSLKIAKM